MSGLENFVARGVKAQNAIDEIISQRAGPRPAGVSGTRGLKSNEVVAGKPTGSAPQGNRGAKDKLDPSTSRSGKKLPSKRQWAKGRGYLSMAVTQSQVHMSTDEHWLESLMVDRDQAPTIRTAAQKRLRALGRRRPRL